MKDEYFMEEYFFGKDFQTEENQFKSFLFYIDIEDPNGYNQKLFRVFFKYVTPSYYEDI